MTPKVERILEELERATALDQLQGLIEALRDEFQVDHMVYHWVSAKGEQYGCGTYSDEWVQRYIDRDYLRVDPVIQGCYQRFHPVSWKRLDWWGKAARAIQLDAINTGWAIRGFRFRSAARTGSLRCSR